MRSAMFWSSAAHDGAPRRRRRSGQVVGVVRQLTAQEAEQEMVGPMYRVRFVDGVETDAFADELQVAGDVAATPAGHDPHRDASRG